MTEQRSDPAGSDVAGAVGSGLMIAVGAAAFWFARDFSSLGSVFPRTIGALMVTLGIAYIVLMFAGRTRAMTPLEGSNGRRAGVAVVMLAWGFTLGPLGFLPSSAVAMAALLVIANHDRWTPRSGVLFAGATAVVLALFYILFKHALLVPLP